MPKSNKRIKDIEALIELRTKKLEAKNQIEGYIDGIEESITILRELDKEGKSG